MFIRNTRIGNRRRIARRRKVPKKHCLIVCVKRPDTFLQALSRNFLMQDRLIQCQFEMKHRSGANALAAKIDLMSLTVNQRIGFSGKHHAGICNRKTV